MPDFRMGWLRLWRMISIDKVVTSHILVQDGGRFECFLRLALEIDLSRHDGSAVSESTDVC